MNNPAEIRVLALLHPAKKGHGRDEDRHRVDLRAAAQPVAAAR